MKEEIIKDLRERIEVERGKIKKVDASWDYNKGYVEYLEAIDKYQSKIEEYDLEIRLMRDYELSDHSTHGDLFTMEEFREDVQCGGFIDSDGSGNYATEDKQSDIGIYPSDFKGNRVRSDFTHVMWFNK